VVVAVIPLVDARVAGVEDKDDDAVGGAGAGAGGGGGLGLAHNCVHCRAVLSCWARLRTNLVAMSGTGVGN
jgi:hypothetical protein